MFDKNIQYLASYLVKHKKHLVIVLIALLSVAASLLSIGFIFRKLIDYGITSSQIDEIHNSIYLMIFAISVFSIGSFFRSYFINLIAVKVVSQIKYDIYKHILKISIVEFEDLKIGDIISRLSADIEIINNLIVNFLSFFIRNIIMLFVAIILMFIQSPKLSSLVLITIPILLIPLLKLSKNVRKLSRMVMVKQGEITANIEENIAGIRTLYAYNQQEALTNQFSNKIASYIQHAKTRLWLRSLFFALAIIAIAGSITIVLWVGTIDISNGRMSSGQMISFMYYAIIVGASAGGIAELFSELQGPLAALDRLVELKNLKNSNLCANKIFPLDRNNYNIKFTDIVFSYPSRPDIIILNKISLQIKHGEFTAIVGKSGSGKSTLMQLLIKFYKCRSGKITIGCDDINDIQDKSIRSKISYVEQYPTIFSGTIKSNITFSNTNYTNDEIEIIAKACGILEFTKNLKFGLDTEIGEKGVRLSGGQKQRIAIARALLYKPEILLLDESTSALDNESERTLLHNIRSLMKNRTIVSIAHRISSIENADKILVVNQGILADQGNHKYLLQNSKIYNIIYNEQQ